MFRFSIKMVVPVMAIALGALVLAGCPTTNPTPRHAGSVCGCPCCQGGKGCCKDRKGGCKGACKGKRGHHGQHFWKKMARIKKMKKLMKLQTMGAPGTLCPRKLLRKGGKLGLTADQISQLKAIQKAAKPSMTDAKLKFRQAIHALKAEWLKDQPDAKVVSETTAKLTTLLQAGAKARMATMLKVQKILTPLQWKKIRTFRGRMGHRGFKGRYKGRRGGCKGCKGGCEGCKGHKARAGKPCDCKGPCKGNCKGRKGYHGRRGKRGKRGHWGKMHRGMRMMGQIVKLGAPKLLCPMMLSKHAEVIGLSADQTAKLKAMLAKAMTGMMDAKLDTRRTLLKLKLAWLADSPDAANLTALGEALWKNIAASMKARAAMLLTLQTLLTAEQWKKLRTMKHHRGGCQGGCKGRKGDCKGRKGKPCKAGAPNHL